MPGIVTILCRWIKVSLPHLPLPLSCWVKWFEQVCQLGEGKKAWAGISSCYSFCLHPLFIAASLADTRLSERCSELALEHKKSY